MAGAEARLWWVGKQVGSEEMETISRGLAVNGSHTVVAEGNSERGAGMS